MPRKKKAETPKTEKTEAPKPNTYTVANDRVLIGGRVHVRGEKLTEGKDIAADLAAKYVKNGWLK